MPSETRSMALDSPCGLQEPGNTFRILLVAEEPEDSTVVREMLPRTEGPAFALEAAFTMMDALDCVARVRPDAILLGLDLPDTQGIETLRAVRAHAPGIPILVWTGVENHQVARAAVQAGAQDYLVKSRLNGPALARALQFAVMRQSTQAPATPGGKAVTIGVLGAKGGVGTTTLACYLSMALRQMTGQPALLADLDLSAGQVAFLMKASSPYSVMDAATNLHRLDGDYWNALIAEGAGDVTVIRSPAEAAMADYSTAQRIRHVFRFLRARYPWVVVDLARFSGLSAELTGDLTYLLLVTTPDVPALLEAKQILARLAECGVPRDRVRLVLNRLTRNAALSRAEVEKLLGAAVYSLPNNYAALSESYATGQLMPLKTDLRQHIARLAAQLAGIELPCQHRALRFGRFRAGTTALLRRYKGDATVTTLQLPAPSLE